MLSDELDGKSSRFVGSPRKASAVPVEYLPHDRAFAAAETGPASTPLTRTIRSMSPVILLVSLCVAAAAIPGFAQTAKSERDILDVIVFYANPPSEVGRYASDVREELKRYLQRVRGYRPRPRPPGLGSEMTMVYAAREGYEGKLVAAASTPGVERLAQEYVDTLRPCYEWEGFHDCPEREAIFAERYVLAHPATPFAELLRLLAAHRWLCTAEAYEYEQQPANAARARREYQNALDRAVRSESRLMRAAAEELRASDRCFASDPFRRPRE